jgi:squalene synthase HpnC
MNAAPATLPPVPSPGDILSRSRSENFPVALRLLPAEARSDLEAIYGFARLIDHLGDELPGYRQDRLAALDAAAAQLDRALGGGFDDADPLVSRAAQLVRRRRLDPQPLYDLIAANRMDQQVTAYATFESLLGYCRLSANPVGRLVLGVFGSATPERIALSDSVCSGLQLAEHWQDVAEDAAAGRVYLPGEDMERFWVTRADLTGPTSGPSGARLRALLAFEATRARELLAGGDDLVASLSGWARVAVAGYVAGGRAALDALAAAGFDPRPGTPRPRSARTARHAVALLLGPRRLTRLGRTRADGEGPA